MHTRLVLVVLACVIAITQTQRMVVEVVAGSDNHTTLEALVIRADLATTLSANKTKFTLFAPTDAAFTALPAGDLKTKLTAGPISANHKALLQDVLKFHMISAEAAIMGADLPATATSVDTMSLGNTLTLRSVAPQVKAGAVEATVSSADLTATNGVVHSIDKLLLPPSCSRTVVGIATGSTDHTKLVELLTAAELVPPLSIDTVGTGYTVFAPTNAAFDKIDTATMSCLALPENKAHLVNLLKYHVVGATVVAGDLTDKMQISSLDTAADKYAFASNGTTLTPLDGTASKITTTNLLATNGVVHVIDSVLISKGFVAKLVCAAPPSSSAPVLPAPGQPLNLTATWRDPKYALCVQPYTWGQLMQGYKDGTLTFRTGGMGGLLEEDGYESWLCLKDHYCVIDHTNPFFCFAYHETKQEWTPWGSNTDLQLVRLQGPAATSTSGGRVSSMPGGKKIQFVQGSNLTLQWSTLQDQELFVMKGPFPRSSLHTEDYHTGTCTVQFQCPTEASELRDKHVCIQTLPMGDGSGVGSADEPYKNFQTCELLYNSVKVEWDEFPIIFYQGEHMPPSGLITLSLVRAPPFHMTSRLQEAFRFRSIDRIISVGTSIVALLVYLPVCLITSLCDALYLHVCKYIFAPCHLPYYLSLFHRVSLKELLST